MKIEERWPCRASGRYRTDAQPAEYATRTGSALSFCPSTFSRSKYIRASTPLLSLFLLLRLNLSRATSTMVIYASLAECHLFFEIVIHPTTATGYRPPLNLENKDNTSLSSNLFFTLYFPTKDSTLNVLRIKNVRLSILSVYKEQEGRIKRSSDEKEVI